jgi:hypothetical protein
MRRGLLVVLGLLLLVAGGAGYWAWRAGYIPFHKEDQIAVPPTPPPVEPPATLARTLFPSADQEARFSLDDGTKSTEWLMPDSDRVIQTYNGQVYITWFLTPEGVYRADPKGTGQPTLLRYLPAELKPGTAWKQPVSNGVVWFKLLKAEGECKPAGQTPADAIVSIVPNVGCVCFASHEGSRISGRILRS